MNAQWSSSGAGSESESVKRWSPNGHHSKVCGPGDWACRSEQAGLGRKGRAGKKGPLNQKSGLGFRVREHKISASFLACCAHVVSARRAVARSETDMICRLQSRHLAATGRCSVARAERLFARFRALPRFGATSKRSPSRLQGRLQFHRHPRVTPRGKTAVREYSYSVLILLYFLHELKARGLNKTTRDGKSSGLRINQRHTSGAGSQAHTTHGGSVNILAHPLRFHIYTLLQSSYGTLSTVHYREIDTNRYQAT